jgi:hypothetical protein
LCIEFLAERADAIGEEAVKDARVAIRRISTVMAILRDTPEAEAPAPPARATSAACRKADAAQFEAKRPNEPSPHE